MRGPEREGPGALSPEERRRITRAAALRPINVLMLVIGAGIFATTLAWWIPPLTLLTYALLVFLSARDPVFGHRVLHGSASAVGSLGAGDRTRPPPAYRCLFERQGGEPQGPRRQTQRG